MAEKEEVANVQVLVNEEEQYSIWPLNKDVPNGWKSVLTAPKEECLAYIENVWTDMRPSSLKRHPH